MAAFPWQSKILEEKLAKARSLFFDFSPHLLVCMLPGLKNACEFEVCYAIRIAKITQFKIAAIPQQSKIFKIWDKLIKAWSFASVCVTRAEKRKWVWGMSVVLTMWKLRNSRWPPFCDNKIFEIWEKLIEDQCLFFDLSPHLLLYMLPGLRNMSEFERVCLW